MLGLEDLVPDVLFLLLVKAPSTAILRGYIRSSPRMYSIFREQRDVILSSVITREIGFKNLPEAQFALRLAQFNATSTSVPDPSEWIPRYQALLASPSSSLTEPSGSELLELLQQHRNVEFMTRLLVRDLLPLLHAGIFTPLRQARLDADEDEFSKISSTEKIRIRRGFYRFMIYSELYRFDTGACARTTPDYRNYHGSYEQCSEFLTLLLAWQVEELSCVNDFLIDKVRQKWCEAENRFYALVEPDPAKWDVDNDYPEGTRWDTDPSFFFSHSAKSTGHDDWQLFTASLPLHDLRILFQASGDDLISIMQQQMFHVGGDFLTDALTETPYYESTMTEFEEYEQAVGSLMKVPFARDSIDRANEAWLWAHKYQPSDLYVEGTYEFKIGEGLRRFGYVFWDSDKIHSMGILHMEPKEVSDQMLKIFPRPILLEDSVEDRIRKLWRSKQEPETWQDDEILAGLQLDSNGSI